MAYWSVIKGRKEEHDKSAWDCAKRELGEEGHIYLESNVGDNDAQTHHRDALSVDALPLFGDYTNNENVNRIYIVLVPAPSIKETQ